MLADNRELGLVGPVFLVANFYCLLYRMSSRRDWGKWSSAQTVGLAVCASHGVWAVGLLLSPHSHPHVLVPLHGRRRPGPHCPPPAHGVTSPYGAFLLPRLPTPRLDSPSVAPWREHPPPPQVCRQLPGQLGGVCSHRVPGLRPFHD